MAQFNPGSIGKQSPPKELPRSMWLIAAVAAAPRLGSFQPRWRLWWVGGWFVWARLGAGAASGGLGAVAGRWAGPDEDGTKEEAGNGGTFEVVPRRQPFSAHISGSGEAATQATPLPAG